MFDSKIPDKPALEKEIASMRRTAFAAGFSEQEVATVYDPRMLGILRKASKYDRMMAAAKPRAEVPGKGRTLTPGAATPLGECAPERTRRRTAPIGEQRQVLTTPQTCFENPLTGRLPMPKVTNAFTTYNAVGNREDLSNVIYNIDPFDTPVMSAIRRRNVKNQTVRLADRVPADYGAHRRSRHGRDGSGDQRAA